MGLPTVLTSCPKAKTSEEWLRRNVPAFISTDNWPSGCPDLNPRPINCGYFGGHGLPKATQQPGQCEDIPSESNGRDPPGDGACRDSRVAGESQSLRRGRGWPF